MKNTYQAQVGSSGELKSSTLIAGKYFEAGAIVNWLPLISSYKMPIKFKFGLDPTYLDIYTSLSDGNKAVLKLPDIIPTAYMSLARTKDRILKHRIRKGEYEGKEKYIRTKLNGKFGLKIWVITIGLVDVSLIFKEESNEYIEIVAAMSIGFKTPDLGSIPIDAAIEANGKTMIKLKVKPEELDSILIIEDDNSNGGSTPPPVSAESLFDFEINYNAILKEELLRYNHFESVVHAQNNFSTPISSGHIPSNPQDDIIINEIVKQYFPPPKKRKKSFWDRVKSTFDMEDEDDDFSLW